MSERKIEITPAQIAASLSRDGRAILRKAIEPPPHDTFPGLMNPDRKALVAAGLVTEAGYFVKATDLGRRVVAAMSDE